MRAFIFLLTICVLPGCTTNKKVPRIFEGIWIPETIDWKDGSFKFLKIQDTSFVQISSTQAKDEKDSIYFMVEPGLNFSAGTIKTYHNVAIVRFRDLYKHVPLVSDNFPGEIKIDTVYFETNTQDRIVYQGKRYHKTQMIKRESVERMISISNYYINSLKK